MTPGELGSRLVELIPGAVAAVSLGELTVTVDAPVWTAAATAARDDELCATDYLDLLTAWETPGGFVVALQVWSTAYRHRVRLVTEVGAESPRVASLTGVYPGVDWHERETAEMFGIDFPGHPNLVPLLLPDPVIASTGRYPLRKAVTLAAREARPWPGDVQP